MVKSSAAAIFQLVGSSGHCSADAALPARKTVCVMSMSSRAADPGQERADSVPLQRDIRVCWVVDEAANLNVSGAVSPLAPTDRAVKFVDDFFHTWVSRASVPR